MINKDWEFGFCFWIVEWCGKFLVCEVGDYIYEGGYYVVFWLFEKLFKLDVIFCVNDIMVLGVLDVL